MASIRPCNKCGERISIRQMPHQQWVAFDVATDNPHKCSKKKTIQKKEKKRNKNDTYSEISFDSEIEPNFEDKNLDNENFQNEIDEIKNLKNLKKSEYLSEKEIRDKLKEDPTFRWALSDNIFANPLVIAIIIIIILSIFVYQ